MRLRANEAKVPSVVAKTVAHNAINKLLRAPSFHLSEQTVVIFGSEQSPTIMRYHLNENASGSKRNISGVNCRNGEEENDIGITAINGITRKNKTNAHRDKYM